MRIAEQYIPAARGTTAGLIPFLSSMGLECPSYHNPADYVMEVANNKINDKKAIVLFLVLVRMTAMGLIT